MSEKREEFLKRISVRSEEEIQREKQEYFERIKDLEDRGNVFFGARLQSEELRRELKNK